MNVEIRTEDARFLFGEYINRIFFAACENGQELFQNFPFRNIFLSKREIFEKFKKMLSFL